MNRNPCLKTLKYIVQTERAIVAGFGLLIVVCVGVYLLSAVTIGTSLSKLLEGVFVVITCVLSVLLLNVWVLGGLLSAAGLVCLGRRLVKPTHSVLFDLLVIVATCLLVLPVISLIRA